VRWGGDAVPGAFARDALDAGRKRFEDASTAAAEVPVRPTTREPLLGILAATQSTCDALARAIEQGRRDQGVVLAARFRDLRRAFDLWAHRTGAMPG
jgi:hypothetical protein